MSKFLLGMVALRIISGTIEIMAALTMYRLNSVEKALFVNSMLAMVGPIVLILTTSLGLIGMADRLSYGKLIWIAAGLTCLFIGIFKK